MNRLLKMAIYERSLTQTDLAKAVGLTEPTISRIVRGHREASDEEKRAIARLLKKKVHEIFLEATV